MEGNDAYQFLLQRIFYFLLTPLVYPKLSAGKRDSKSLLIKVAFFNKGCNDGVMMFPGNFKLKQF